MEWRIIKGKCGAYKGRARRIKSDLAPDCHYLARIAGFNLKKGLTSFFEAISIEIVPIDFGNCGPFVICTLKT